MIYLAAPYTHDDPNIMNQRFEKASHIAAEFSKKGFLVFSPITHGHPISKNGLPTDFEHWKKLNDKFLDVCSEVWVLTLPGHKKSRGIAYEINRAINAGKKIALVEPETRTVNYFPTPNDLDLAVTKNQCGNGEIEWR